MLLLESAHRIANQLAMVSGLISLQIRGLRRRPRQISSDEAIDLLEDVRRATEAISDLHRLLAERPLANDVDLADFLPRITEAIVTSLAADGRATVNHRRLQSCPVPPETALHIGLLVGELVTNAVKYAHPTGVDGRIEVAVERDGAGGLVIEVSDDGVGLPEDFDVDGDGERHGMSLIQQFADKLDARLIFIQAGIGLTVRLEAPDPTLA
jgi:two-component sensor histidine kinase